MDPRASGGVHITRHLLGIAARVRCGGGNVCLAERPPPKLVTDNLDNFSNRGYSHRLSTPSTPQDEATFLLLRGSPALRLSRLPRLSVTEAARRRWSAIWLRCSPTATRRFPTLETTFDILKDVVSTPYTVYTLPVAQIGLFGEIALGELGD